MEVKLLSDNLLNDLGIELTPENRAALNKHFEITLNERVTREIVEELSEQQLEQLVSLKTAPDDELFSWLKSNVPELKEIVEDEIALLLGEIAENGDVL